MRHEQRHKGRQRGRRQRGQQGAAQQLAQRGAHSGVAICHPLCCRLHHQRCVSPQLVCGAGRCQHAGSNKRLHEASNRSIHWSTERAVPSHARRRQARRARRALDRQTTDKRCVSWNHMLRRPAQLFAAATAVGACQAPALGSAKQGQSRPGGPGRRAGACTHLGVPPATLPGPAARPGARARCSGRTDPAPPAAAGQRRQRRQRRHGTTLGLLTSRHASGRG